MKLHFCMLLVFVIALSGCSGFSGENKSHAEKRGTEIKRKGYVLPVHQPRQLPKSPRQETLERIRDSKTLEEKIRIAEAYEARQLAQGNYEWIWIKGRPPEPMPPEPWNTKWRWGTVHGHQWWRLYKRGRTLDERTNAYLKWAKGFDGLEAEDFEEARQYWLDLKKRYENLKAVPPSERIETIYVHKLVHSIVTCKLVEEFRTSSTALIHFGNRKRIPADEMTAIKKELEAKGLLEETNVPQGYEQEWP